MHGIPGITTSDIHGRSRKSAGPLGNMVLDQRTLSLFFSNKHFPPLIAELIAAHLHFYLWFAILPMTTVHARLRM